ncbi:DUF3592 domain-containing protein [Paenarthrobacter sp. JL.01a]|uniref:DUF3592 domain-containing protein n=1 Tax=Paenarthrobacter sp. JL.01a TaxID=2979324 RepID=UPI0021C6501D|nr:DUF3592 domain-containing protein [Paenarthrobacter sp. JL.01a]UXM93835.1 DUF3592 domain-containing protein [Paenarthrobacter sp. JL.01a]
MRLTVAAFALCLSAVVIAACFGLSATLAPFLAGSIRTNGTVTGQQPHRVKSRQVCNISIDYILGNHSQHATVDSGKDCKASLQPGTEVQLAVNPDNPGDIAVLSHGYPRENSWISVAGVAAFLATALVICLLLWVQRYVNTKRLLSQEASWCEMVATVRGRTRSKSGITLYVSAPDTMGNSRIFTMDFTDRGPRPSPKTGDKLDIALLTDGAAHGAVSVKGENKIHLVSFSVPNDFQLRAIG